MGLVPVTHAKLIDAGFELFRNIVSYVLWLPVVITPAGAILAVWLMCQFLRGVEDSDIPQAIATLEGEWSSSLLLFLRIMFGKIVVSLLGTFYGFTTDREEPMVQIGASLMCTMHWGYHRSSKHIGRRLTFARAAVGPAAAFNAPLVDVVFAIEELARNFVACNSGTLIMAIIFSGVVILDLQGNYLCSGHVQVIG